MDPAGRVPTKIAGGRAPPIGRVTSGRDKVSVERKSLGALAPPIGRVPTSGEPRAAATLGVPLRTRSPARLPPGFSASQHLPTRRRSSALAQPASPASCALRARPLGDPRSPSHSPKRTPRGRAARVPRPRRRNDRHGRSGLLRPRDDETERRGPAPHHRRLHRLCQRHRPVPVCLRPGIQPRDMSVRTAVTATGLRRRRRPSISSGQSGAHSD